MTEELEEFKELKLNEIDDTGEKDVSVSEDFVTLC
jgi:hypothetical protein